MHLWYFILIYVNFTHCTVLHQPDSVISVDLDANVTLQCFFAENCSMYDMFWYKQIKGQQPCAVVKVGKRLSLSIINISHWDEAVYYCGVEIFFDIEFGNGVFLTLIYHLLTLQVSSRFMKRLSYRSRYLSVQHYWNICLVDHMSVHQD
uniref:Immunoglobulin domain-containing protein n=1 Tax=Cyprinus carpio TaxID=7962 RepID=A0A8C1UHT3_CYPCA